MSGRLYGKKMPASNTMLHASTAASIKIMILLKNAVKENSAMNNMLISAVTQIATRGVCVTGDIEPRASGATRSKDHATTARTPKVCIPGIHIHIHAISPADTRTVTSADCVNMPASSVMDASVGVVSTPSPGVKMLYTADPTKS